MRINDKGVLINYHDDPDVTRLVIPGSVRKIAPDAFYGAEYLEEVVISEGVTDIGTGAFRGCHELRSVTMPDSVTGLGRYAFEGCRKLGSVRLSKGLKEIPMNCFSSCHSLTSVYIPDNVSIIRDYAFNSCTALGSARLPEGLEHIGSGAFMETFSLRSIELPGGVTELDGYAFFRSGLEHVSWRGMEIYLDRASMDNGVFEFRFSKGLEEWLESGGTAGDVPIRELRTPFMLAYFAKTRSRMACEYVSKRFSKLFAAAIQTNNIPAVKAVIEEGGFLSTRNIGRYITLASEQENKEIYLMLVEHKERLGGYKSSGTSGRFRL